MYHTLHPHPCLTVPCLWVSPSLPQRWAAQSAVASQTSSNGLRDQPLAILSGFDCFYLFCSWILHVVGLWCRWKDKGIFLDLTVLQGSGGVLVLQDEFLPWPAVIQVAFSPRERKCSLKKTETQGHCESEYFIWTWSMNSISVVSVGKSLREPLEDFWERWWGWTLGRISVPFENVRIIIKSSLKA
jgi:hypothetical protein